MGQELRVTPGSLFPKTHMAEMRPGFLCFPLWGRVGLSTRWSLQWLETQTHGKKCRIFVLSILVELTECEMHLEEMSINTKPFIKSL